MARGNAAKDWVAQKIIECFGQANVISADKKLYINTTEDGSPIQVCIAMTCPKTMVGADSATKEPPKSAFSSGFDFEHMGAATVEPEPFKPAEITEDERETVKELMARLGL